VAPCRAGGIFSGMNSPRKYPSFEDVCSDIGDKVVEAMYSSVEQVRADLALYRDKLPELVARHSDRGLANWIHDMMWASLAGALEDHPEVTIVDNGVTREIHCGINYRFRAKRHDEDGAVKSFPTQTVLDFHYQPQTLDTLEDFKLDFGYQWDPEIRSIGPAVMSLRQKKALIWNSVIPSNGSSALGTTALSGGPAPASGPAISITVPNKTESQAQEQ
jgi:hypothetical protein